MFDFNNQDFTFTPDYVEIAAKLLEIDFELARTIGKAHVERVSAASIIKRLEQGTITV